MPLTTENEFAHRIIGFAIEIHKALGPGLDEETYRKCLLFELENAEMPFEIWKSLPFQYKSLDLENAYLMDILVDEKVVVLIESTEHIAEYHVLKMVRLLKNGNYKLGLIINFNSGLISSSLSPTTSAFSLPSVLSNAGICLFLLPGCIFLSTAQYALCWW